MISVIFDMAGTLLDTQQVCIPAWDKAGENQGFHNMGRCIPDVCGTNIVGWSAYLRKNFPTLDIDKFNSDARRYTIEMLVVRYKPGAEELLKYLKSKEIKLALASGSSHESINHHLEAVGGKDSLDVIVDGVDVPNGKPAPHKFLLAAEKLGVSPETCVVLEDSGNGVKAAAAAGMRCIGIPDIAPFTDDVKKLLFAEFSSMCEAHALLEKLI